MLKDHDYQLNVTKLENRAIIQLFQDGENVSVKKNDQLTYVISNEINHQSRRK